MTRFRLPIFSLVICLVIAGCGGGSIPERTVHTEQVQTTSLDGQAIVEGGELPVDAHQTFRRVERLVGTSGPTPTVKAEKIDPRPARERTRSGKFNELMKYNVTYPPVEKAAGGTRGVSVQIVYTDAASPGRIERTLAHEFVHVLQPEKLDSKLRESTTRRYRRTTDTKFAHRSVTEGTAVYFADEYANNYLGDAASHAAELQRKWSNMSIGLRSYWAPYYYGQEYVRERFESESNVEDIYADPPQTAEQVLYGYSPDEEPRRPLEIDAEATASEWNLITKDTKGELFIRHVMETELPRKSARRAASGWGNDRLFTYYRGAKASHVWILRWDDIENASEFEAGFEKYLERRGERTGRFWRDEGTAFGISKPSPETVAVVAGEPEFLNNVTVTATEPGDEISVTVRDAETEETESANRTRDGLLLDEGRASRVLFSGSA